MTNDNAKNDIDTGNLGEKVAQSYLERNKYRILEKNYHTRNPFWKGEIDIIAEKDRVIIFVEVKTADNPKTDSFPAEERVNDKKKKQLIRLANSWFIDNKRGANCKWQIDIIRVIIDHITQRAKIRHIKNAISDRY
ncbi:MAG: YraN family protein [bacterium]